MTEQAPHNGVVGVGSLALRNEYGEKRRCSCVAYEVAAHMGSEASEFAFQVVNIIIKATVPVLKVINVTLEFAVFVLKVINVSFKGLNEVCEIGVRRIKFFANSFPVFYFFKTTKNHLS